MKRIIGLCMFWLGIGMAVQILIPLCFCSVCFTLIFIIAGYYLFCN